MEISSALVAFAVIVAIAYWVNGNRRKASAPSVTKERAKASPLEITQAGNDYKFELEQAGEEVKVIIHHKAMKYGIDFSNEELDWLLGKTWNSYVQRDTDDGLLGALLKVKNDFQLIDDGGNDKNVLERFKSLRREYKRDLSKESDKSDADK